MSDEVVPLLLTPMPEVRGKLSAAFFKRRRTYKEENCGFNVKMKVFVNSKAVAGTFGRQVVTLCYPHTKK